MSNLKTIEVKVLDSATDAERTKAETEAIADGSKVVDLSFQETKGDVTTGISWLERMHKSAVEFPTHASGEIALGPILPLAGGKFGERQCDSTALFIFVEDSAKAGKGRRTITAVEKNALEILGKLSGGRKARIKTFMLTGQKATASEMKSLGLIDKIEGEFIDKYSEARKTAKENAKKK